MTADVAARPTGHETCHHRYYYMSCPEFDLLLARAANHCEFCGIKAEDTPRGVLCIDHDNLYGFLAVRGLVCDKCNSHFRYVDAGERPRGDGEWRYYREAWFLDSPRFRRGASPVTDPHVDWQLWHEFGRLVGRRKGSIVKQFIQWYCRTGVPLPKRLPREG